MADPVGGAVFDPEEAAGRRRRGLIIVGVIAVVGIPLTVADWWSTREVERKAAEVVADLQAVEVEDVGSLFGAEVRAFATGGPSPIDEALGHGVLRTGAVPAPRGGLALAYEVRHGLETRCIHVLVTEAGMTTEVSDRGRCEPREGG